MTQRVHAARPRTWAFASVSVLLSVAMGVGCVGDKGVAPSTRDPSTALGGIVASPLNVVMAVGDSFPVAITAQSVSGDPITQFDSVRYVLNSIVDTIRVGVSPTGVVTARAVSGGSPVLLNVFAYKDGVGAVDQVVIQVTQTAIAGATLSIQPDPSDSTKIQLGDGKVIPPVIQNPGTGARVSGPRFRFTTTPEDAKKLGCYRLNIPSVSQAFSTASSALRLNGCAATFGLNQIRALSLGTAWVHADALIYGTMLHDSVQYTVTNPYQFYISVTNVNLNVTCVTSGTIAPGGTVTFTNNIQAGLGMSLAYTFDNPAAATDAGSSTGGSSGNITPLAGGESSSRMFMTPGTYTWHAAVSGATPPFTNTTCDGTVIVQ